MSSRIFAPFLVVLAIALAGCGNESDSNQAVDPPPVTTSPGPADQPSETVGTCTYAADGSTPAKAVTPPASQPTEANSVAAVMTTSAGTINLVLKPSDTPCTVNSFVSLAKQNYFDGTVCHRLTTDGIWVLQCGDPTATGGGGPGYAFADELSGSETYPAGTLAMANAGPGTNGSQFFLVYKDSQLPPAYTVFGKMDGASIRVVQQIAAKGTAEGGTDGSPKEPVEVQSVVIR